MKKVSQVLIESQKTRKQIFERLWNNYAMKVSDINEYCAMGALMCESGLIQENEVNSVGTLVGPADEELFACFMGKDEYHILDNTKCNFCVHEENFVEGRDTYSKDNPYVCNWLSSYIIHMNDYHHVPFEKIGKELERLGF